MENIRGFIATNSPEWGFTSMTTDKARGYKSKYGFGVRRGGRYYFLFRPRNSTGQAPTGLWGTCLYLTPGYTGGHHCQDPSDLAIQPPHTVSVKKFFNAVRPQFKKGLQKASKRRNNYDPG
jgi:hypothetical protein